MATNAEVAAAFEELAVLSEILGANVFKVNAFRKAARAVEALARSAVEMPVAELKEVEGLGASTAAKVLEFGGSGTMAELEELRAQVPAGLKEVLAIQGIGPKTAQKLIAEFGSVEKLIENPAALNGRGGAPAVAIIRSFARALPASSP